MSHTTKNVCPCTDKTCVSHLHDKPCIPHESLDRETFRKNRGLSKSSLTTDFRKLVFSKHEDIIKSIFDFEESCSKKLDVNKQKLDALKKDIDLMKSNANKKSAEQDELTSKLNKLKQKYELEKNNIVTENDDKLKEVVTIFNTNMERVHNALEQHWTANLKCSKETSAEFDAALMRYKEMVVNEVNGKSEKITQLKEILNKSQENRKLLEKELTSRFQHNKEFNHDFKFDIEDVKRRVNEIISTQKKLQEKYMIFLSRLSK